MDDFIFVSGETAIRARLGDSLFTSAETTGAMGEVSSPGIFLEGSLVHLQQPQSIACELCVQVGEGMNQINALRQGL